MSNRNRLAFYYQNVLRQDLLLKCSHSNIMDTAKLTNINILVQVSFALRAAEQHQKLIKQKQLALEIISGQKVVQFIPKSDSKLLLSSASRNRNFRPRLGSKVSPSKCYLRLCLRKVACNNFIEKVVNIAGGVLTENYSYNNSLLSFSKSVSPKTKLSLLNKSPEVLFVSQDLKIQIKGNIIELIIASNILKLFPEIQNLQISSLQLGNNDIDMVAEGSQSGIQISSMDSLFSSQNTTIQIVTSAKSPEETFLFWSGLFARCAATEQKEISYDKSN